MKATIELTKKISEYKSELEKFDKISGICNAFTRNGRMKANIVKIVKKFNAELKNEIGSTSQILAYLDENYYNF